VGDGTTDDTAALQMAFNVAATGGYTIVFAAGRSYKVTSELRLGTGPGRILCVEGHGSSIDCAAAMRSVLAVIGDIARIRDLLLNGHRLAANGIYYESASTSVFENVEVYEATVDGFHSQGDSDRCILRNCSARICGTVFVAPGYAGAAPAVMKTPVAGTVSAATMTISGALVCVITGSGTSFLATGARRGDFISLDSQSPGTSQAGWLQILSVDSDTQITCFKYPDSSCNASNLQYSIHVGDGYHEGPGHADNNIHRLDTFLAENCACAGVKVGGLSGPRVTNLQVNAAFAYPVVVADAHLQTIASSFVGSYFEECAAADNFFLGGAAGISLDTINGTGQPVLAADGFTWGTVVNMQNASDPGRLDAIGSTPLNYVPSMRIGIDALAEGVIHSRSHGSYGTAGAGSLTMWDDAPDGSVKLVSGVESRQGGYSPTSVGYLFDTWTAISNRSLDPHQPPEADLLTKHLAKFANGGAFSFGIGFRGDIRTTSADISATPGVNGPIDAPSGRFALAVGATSVTILCACCKSGSKVMLSKLSLNQTATDFMVSTADGSFTITANASATRDPVLFDFLVVNNGA
jgi:hypothetical protein